MTYKIAIITCWMGTYPDYFPLWVKSCEKNPQIDWFLVADRKPTQKLPSNIIFYRMSLSEIRARVEKEIKLDGSGLTSPYKLCDFRPAYGFIFKQELQGYTHWGHCDIDLVFGDFNTFLSDELLEKYDKIYTKGHLGIYRNTELVNRRCFDLGSVYPFSTVLSNPNFYAFDECTGMERIYKKNGYAYYQEAPYIDVSVRYKSSFLLNVAEKNYPKQAFFWEKGKVYRAFVNSAEEVETDEWLYLHFQKKNPTVKIEDVNAIESFWIGPNGFMEKKEGVVTVEDIEKYNPSISTQQAKKEKKAYFKKKLKEFFVKPWKDKCIHIKQRISRLLF